MSGMGEVRSMMVVFMRREERLRTEGLVAEEGWMRHVTS